MDPKPPYAVFADDDPDDLDLIIPLFAHKNPEVGVFTLNSGLDVVKWYEACLSKAPPVLILLDYKIDNITAGDILRLLKQTPKFAAVPKFVWSTSLRTDHIAECMGLGAEAYLEKPANTRQLEMIILQLSAAMKKSDYRTSL